MQHVRSFLRHYRLFSFAAGSLLVSFGLVLNHQQSAAHYVLAVASLLAALPILWEIIQTVRVGSYSIDILAVISIVSAVLLRQYWAAITVVALFSGGRALEDSAIRRASTVLAHLTSRLPTDATIIRKNKPLSIRTAEIRIGDKVLITRGEIMPVNGTVISGVSEVDESLLTGEILQTSKTVGDAVLSGTRNVREDLTITATAEAAHSHFQRAVRVVRSASTSRSPFMRLAERYSLPFTVATVAVAVAVWVVSGHAIRFLDVVIVATPVPLLLAAPLAMTSGLGRAARHGIFVKNAHTLETLSDITSLAMSKNGILTNPPKGVSRIISFENHTEDDILQLAASLEQQANHEYARAIVAEAGVRHLKLMKAKHIKTLANAGVSAHIQGKDVIVGKWQYLETAGMSLPPDFSLTSVHSSAVFVAANNVVIGIIVLNETVRSEVETTFQQFRRLGIRNFKLVTGDAKESAQHVAQLLGISEVHASQLPTEKLHLLEATPAKLRPIAYIGSTVSDGPVLASADIGVALGVALQSGTFDSAHVCVMADDLTHVASAIAIAQRTMRVASRSIVIGILLNILLIVIFATGKVAPIYGALSQGVIDVVVIALALRART